MRFFSTFPWRATWRHVTRSASAHVMACCLTAPLPESILIYQQRNIVAFSRGQFHRKYSKYLPLLCVWKLLIYYFSRISQGPMSWTGFQNCWCGPPNHDEFVAWVCFHVFDLNYYHLALLYHRWWPWTSKQYMKTNTHHFNVMQWERLDWLISPWKKMDAISQTTFSNAFSWLKVLYFDSNLPEVCS